MSSLLHLVQSMLSTILEAFVKYICSNKSREATPSSFFFFRGEFLRDIMILEFVEIFILLE